MINTFQYIFLGYKNKKYSFRYLGRKDEVIYKGKNMGWSYTSPQPHLKIEYKDLMSKNLQGEKKKKGRGKKGKEKEMEGGKEGKKEEKEINRLEINNKQKVTKFLAENLTSPDNFFWIKDAIKN